MPFPLEGKVAEGRIGERVNCNSTVFVYNYRDKSIKKYSLFKTSVGKDERVSRVEKYGEMFSLYNPKRRWTMALCSTIYDVCNDFISHGILTRYLSGERELALQHCEDLERLGVFQNSIIGFDRGY